jgi:hypothetical protein
VSNILERRKLTGSGVQYSSREGGLAVGSNILERMKWTGSGVQYSGREGVD